MFSIPGRNTATGLILLTLTWLGAAPLAAQSSEDKDPKALVERMVRTIGGKDALYKLKDVQYTYIYQDAKTGKQDVSTERYIFDGELSWAEYHKTDCTMPDVNGTLVQSYDGKQSWTTLDGNPVEEVLAVSSGLAPESAAFRQAASTSSTRPRCPDGILSSCA